MKVPCRHDCKDRNIYCHSQCKEYLNYRKLRDEYNEEKRKDIDFISYSISSSDRMGVGRRI